jgi:hypothetical protein
MEPLETDAYKQFQEEHCSYCLLQKVTEKQ